MKNVTMRDIGAALGVSTVTISKALSGKEGVSDAVREKIIETATTIPVKMSTRMAVAMSFPIVPKKPPMTEPAETEEPPLSSL